MRSRARFEAGLAASLVAPAVVAPRLVPEAIPFTALGPLGSGLLFVPLVLLLVAMVAERADPRARWPLRLVARASVWVLLALVIVDPARNLPDWVAGSAGAGMTAAAGGVRWVVGGLVALVIAGVVVSALVSGGGTGSERTDRATVQTGSSLHPVVAFVARLILRLAAGLVFLAIGLVLVAVAWTADGIAGVRAVISDAPAPSRVASSLAGAYGGVRSVGGRSIGLLGRASAGWGQRSSHGVWTDPCSVSRDETGARHIRPWTTHASMSPDDDELRELGALVDAYDVALTVTRPRQPGESRGPGPQAIPELHPYVLRVARAWSRPEYHALVLQAEPPAAAAAMARVPLDQLVSALDAATRWTGEDLRGLRLSDRRVRDDPLRSGITGLFIGFDRPGRSEAEVDTVAPDDPSRRAVDRALREAGLGSRYRYHGTEETADGSTVLEYRASWRTAGEWAELQRGWEELARPIAVYARAQTVRMTVTLDPYSFIATIPVPEGTAWPSGAATDWQRVVETTPVSERHPSLVTLGLDRRGEPLTADLSGETGHALVAGGTGSGKSSLVLATLASLAYRDLRIAERLVGSGRRWPPLELSLIEGVKRDLTSRFGAMAVESVAVIDEDDAIDAVERYLAVIEARYRELDGRPFDPTRMGRRLLVIEEFGSLRLAMTRQQDERLSRAVTRIANTGRGVACGMIVAVQRAAADTVPPAKGNMLRITGFQPQAGGYVAALDVSTRNLLPRIPGRMAMQGPDGLVIFQALHARDESIRELVEDWVRVFRAGPAGLPGPIPADEPDDPLPRRPTRAEIAELTPLAVARLLYRQRDADSTALVSVRGSIALARDLGYVAGRQEAWTEALAELERLGILVQVADHPTAGRRVAIPDWPMARQVILSDGART